MQHAAFPRFSPPISHHPAYGPRSRGIFSCCDNQEKNRKQLCNFKNHMYPWRLPGRGEDRPTLCRGPWKSNKGGGGQSQKHGTCKKRLEGIYVWLFVRKTNGRQNPHSLHTYCMYVMSTFFSDRLSCQGFRSKQRHWNHSCDEVIEAILPTRLPVTNRLLYPVLAS